MPLDGGISAVCPGIEMSLPMVRTILVQVCGLSLKAFDHPIERLTMEKVLVPAKIQETKNSNVESARDMKTIKLYVLIF